MSKAFLAQHPLCGMRPDGQRHTEHSQCAQQGRIVAAQCTDHILAKVQGGTDDWHNLQALCLACNTRKANLFEGRGIKSLGRSAQRPGRSHAQVFTVKQGPYGW